MDILPIDEHIENIANLFAKHSALVLVATPGAGKTTRIPPALVRQSKPLAKTILLEPRRLAARAAADRIAKENNWTLGKEVGYQVRFENRTCPETRLIVMTEGILSKRLLHDPYLDGIDTVIIDEFHERSWHTDIALGLLRDLQQTVRSELKILVMSATVDAAPLAKFLGDVPIYEVAGKLFPIEISYSDWPQRLTTGQDFINETSAFLRALLDGKVKSSGDILVFLPGVREIGALSEEISPIAKQLNIDVLSLHGNLSLEDQQRAIRKSERRRIILSTNVAESSVTLDGVATVVDSGLARILRQDNQGFSRLQLSRISRASATQRAGRSGRQQEGLCYRLWNKMDMASMQEYETPEILRIDVSEAVLLLASQGINHPQNFSWYEPPAVTNMDSSLRSLRAIGALDSENRITELGRQALLWPLAPRLGCLMQHALTLNLTQEGALLCAILSERDFVTDNRSFQSYSNLESDILLRMHLFEDNQQSTSYGIQRQALFAAKRTYEQLHRLCQQTSTRKSAPTLQIAQSQIPKSTEDRIKFLILLAYSDRLCRRRGPKSLDTLMVGKKGLRLSRTSSVEQAELFVALETIDTGSTSERTDPTISMASEVKLEWLKHLFPADIQPISEATFDSQTKQVMSQAYLAFKDLPLERPKLSRATANEAQVFLVKYLIENWLTLIAAMKPSVLQWLSRLRFAATTFPDLQFPNIDEKFKTEVVNAACYGETSIEATTEKDWLPFFKLLLSREQNALLEKEIPSHITVPTGNEIRIEYPEARQPYFEVRLQEVFGWQMTPKIAKERVNLQIHLLGPNFRPVQVTSDLKSFWANGYIEVRKELRARYPKHSWPEDPLSAKPEAKGPRRRS